MTRIDFYHGAADKLAAACRLIYKLYQQGRRIVVFAPEPAMAAQIDRLLWTQPAIAFIPHCAATAPIAAETPILISTELSDANHDDVLVSLAADVAPGFGRFAQLVEVVGPSEEDRAAARQRFKFYRDRGYPLAAYDLAAQ